MSLYFDVVRRALRRYRRIARMFRRGGLGDDVALATEALAALDKIQKPELGLFDEEENGPPK